MQFIRLRAALAGASITVLALFGGMFLGIVLGFLNMQVLSGHALTDTDPLHIALATFIALAGLLAGSAVWGVAMGRFARSTDSWRMARAGFLGFAPITLLIVVAFQFLEPVAVGQLGALIPIHRLFTLFFVPAAFLIAGVSGWAIGIGLNERGIARKLFWQVGIAAALGFLTVNLGMQAAGWQVGAPDAADRFTMLTVLFAGNLGAAIVGGAVMGVLIARTRPNPLPPLVSPANQAQSNK